MNDFLPLVAYFIIYSFIGWVLESTYKSVLQKKWVNSGFLHGPICPIYGYGAMIMYLSLRNLTNNIFILFWFGLIVLSAFEYVVGWLLEITLRPSIGIILGRCSTSMDVYVCKIRFIGEFWELYL